MNVDLTLEPIAVAPWGNGPREIPLTLEDFPLFGEMSAEQMRKTRAPIRIRLDGRNCIHALSGASLRNSGPRPAYIHHFDPEGGIVGRTPLPIDNPEVDSLNILDYLVDTAGSCYLLEQIQSQPSSQSHNRLRKIDKDGKVQWSRTGPSSKDELDFHKLKGTFKRLLLDARSRLYLPAAEHAGIAEIDPTTGDISHVYTPGAFSNEVFIDGQETVFFVLYFPDKNRRGIGSFNLDDQRFTSSVGGEELYGWLLYPFGADASSNLYVWRNPVIAQISLKGRIEAITSLNNIVVRSKDETIFTSNFLSDDARSPAVQVERRSPGGAGARQELYLPKELSQRHGGEWRLIHVDVRDRYYVFGGEEPGRAGTLLIYSSEGALEETIFPPADLLPIESRLAGHQLWQVDSQGRIYFPVTDAEGFKVVRLAKS